MTNDNTTAQGDVCDCLQLWVSNCVQWIKTLPPEHYRQLMAGLRTLGWHEGYATVTAKDWEDGERDVFLQTIEGAKIVLRHTVEEHTNDAQSLASALAFASDLANKFQQKADPFSRAGKKKKGRDEVFREIAIAVKDRLYKTPRKAFAPFKKMYPEVMHYKDEDTFCSTFRRWKRKLTKPVS